MDTPVYKVREMYFGTRDEFEYQQCAACACLQIVAIPENLGQYYPDDYYSKHVKQQYRDHAPPSALRELKLNACLGKRRLLSLVLFFLREPRLPPWVAYLDINSRTRILDVGCGAGKLLLKLGKKGFRFLEGVDPFIDETITYDNGVKIYKNQIWNIAREEDARNGYDLVMMHHSLEHIPDQHRTLSAAYDLLNKNGLLLIRVPLSCSWAWQHYRENWVQIDSPRHLYLHSIKSIEVLAQKHGFSSQVDISTLRNFSLQAVSGIAATYPCLKKEADVFTTRRKFRITA
ncbi:MAG: class I SAM-dependent methyltransferase [Haliea sp.]|nr:class I SAM-dependent methyltransferase [Haliea sp.]